MNDKDQSNWLSSVRRDFHSHPELSLEETRTTARILEILGQLNIPARGFPEIPGAVGLVKGSGKGPCLGLRADMDALPVTERNEVPYCSRTPGVMHACGHDAHTTIMLGVARRLSLEMPDPVFKGSVKLIFQPAEEREFGAKTLIEHGVLEDPHVDRVLAGHMSPGLDVGEIGIFKTRGYASADYFQIRIEGRGGHGGRPHQTRDPLMAGAYLVTALQTIVSRNLSPVDSGVVTVGKFRAGRTRNVIPHTACLEGTIRTHSDNSRDLIFQRLEEIIRGTEVSFGVRCYLDIIPDTPGCNNDETVSTFLYEIAADLLGEDKVSWLTPTMGAEDFAFFTRARPGAIARIGCRNKETGIVNPLHSPYFDIDERALDIGVEFFYRAVKAYLK